MPYEIKEEYRVQPTEQELVALCLRTLSDLLGVKIMLTYGGPSVSDPCGEVKYYLGIRGTNGSAAAIKIADNGLVQPVR